MADGRLTSRARARAFGKYQIGIRTKDNVNNSDTKITPAHWYSGNEMDAQIDLFITMNYKQKQ